MKLKYEDKEYGANKLTNIVLFNIFNQVPFLKTNILKVSNIDTKFMACL